jgi:hypothetical protein
MSRKVWFEPDGAMLYNRAGVNSGKVNRLSKK